MTVKNRTRAQLLVENAKLWRKLGTIAGYCLDCKLVASRSDPEVKATLLRVAEQLSAIVSK